MFWVVYSNTHTRTFDKRTVFRLLLLSIIRMEDAHYGGCQNGITNATILCTNQLAIRYLPMIQQIINKKLCIELGLLLYIANSTEEKGQCRINRIRHPKVLVATLCGSVFNHLIGTLIQPLAKAIAKITNGVDIPNMII